MDDQPKYTARDRIIDIFANEARLMGDRLIEALPQVDHSLIRSLIENKIKEFERRLGATVGQ